MIFIENCVCGWSKRGRTRRAKSIGNEIQSDFSHVRDFKSKMLASGGGWSCVLVFLFRVSTTESNPNAVVAVKLQKRMGTQKHFADRKEMDHSKKKGKQRAGVSPPSLLSSSLSICIGAPPNKLHNPRERQPFSCFFSEEKKRTFAGCVPREGRRVGLYGFEALISLLGLLKGENFDICY